MGNYATQMEAARKGIQTEELTKVAAKEIKIIHASTRRALALC